MASKEDLCKIGIDGYNIIDGYIVAISALAQKKRISGAAPRKPHHIVPRGTAQVIVYQYHEPQQTPPNYQVKPVSANEIKVEHI